MQRHLLLESTELNKVGRGHNMVADSITEVGKSPIKGWAQHEKVVESIVTAYTS